MGTHASKMLSHRLLILAACACAVSTETMLLHTISPPNDPHHTHCQDVKADMDDHAAQQWWSGNAWAYPASQGWTNGSLCDQKVFPVVEHENNPIGVDSVTLRRLGHAPPMMLAGAQETIRKFEVGDNHCTELVVDMAKNNSQCLTYQWWTDNQWHYASWNNGTCPAPYTKLDRTDHPIAVRCIDLDIYGQGSVEPLTESADEAMIIHNIAPGAQHCTELYWQHGKQNAYWKAHGYQYPQPLWMPGKCDRTKYNWWNRNGTVAIGVTS